MVLHNRQGRASKSAAVRLCCDIARRGRYASIHDEINPDRDDDTGVEEDESESGGEDVVDDEDAQIPSEEVDELIADAYC